MGKVIIHATMTLDGYIARPDDTIDWAFKFGADEMIDEIMREIGDVVMGNGGFREGTMDESTLPYGGMLKVPQFIVTHEVREPVTIVGCHLLSSMISSRRLSRPEQPQAKKV
jgi:dihydrofolate reductase